MDEYDCLGGFIWVRLEKGLTLEDINTDTAADEAEKLESEVFVGARILQD